jgi:type II secretory pathway pseudopilin PulG
VGCPGAPHNDSSADKGFVGRQRRTAPADGGWTLAETVVSMALVSVAGAIFTAGFVQIYRTFTSTQVQTAAQQQLTTAILRLDREVPYASALSRPAQVGGDWYAEYLTGSGGTPTCVELRLNAAARQLQRRTWANGTSPISPTPWIPLASDVTVAVSGTGTAVAPFTLVPADAEVHYPRLLVTVAGTSGRQTESSWPALNAGTDATDTICTDARGTP